MAPTLVTSYKVTTGDTANTATLTTPSFTPAVGELIVVKVGAQDEGSPTLGSLTSTGGLVFTHQDSYVASSKCPARLSTAQVGASSSMTVSSTWSGSSGRHFMVVERWSSAVLPASPNLASPKTGSSGTAPSTTLVTQAAGSAVTWYCQDWDGISGTRTYRSGATEITWERPSSMLAWYDAYQSAASPGSQTLGMTSPLQKWTLLGIELQDNTGTLSVAPTGIDTGEAFGSPVVDVAEADQAITGVGGIATGEAFGSPTFDVTPLDQTIVAVGIASGEAFGAPLVELAATDQTVVTVGIDTGEAFGSPVVAVGDAPLIVAVTGTDSAEAFGIPDITVDAPELVIDLTDGGIGTGEVIGLPVVAVETPVPGDYIRDTYFIDGVDLSGYAWRIETAEGTLIAPETIGDNPALPGQDGATQVFAAPGQQRRPSGLGLIAFNMWLKGVDRDTGDIPGGSSSGEQWYERVDELMLLLYRRRVTIDHPRLDGTRRAVDCYLVPGQSIAPSRVPSSPWFGRLKATFAIPGAHWADLDAVTTGQVSLATNGLLGFGAFAGSTAVCTDLTVTFGAGNNPRLTTSYNFVGWNNVIASGRELGIDASAGTTHQAGGAAWTPGYDALVYSPGPRLFEIDPSEPLTAILTHTGGGTMTVEVAGKRRYRTS